MSGSCLDIRCYIPSFNNAVAVAESVASCASLPVVVVDNGSSPEQVAALQTLSAQFPNCTLIAHGENIGRVENWTFCIEHFLQTPGADWFKWVFAGDTLVPNVGTILARAALNHPQVRFIVADYELVLPDGRIMLRQELPQTQVFAPADALRLAARQGNWFGAPLAHCIHRDALADGFAFGAFAWSADFAFCVGIAARFETLYLRESIGRFELKHRRFHQANADGHGAVLQDALVRLDAARLYRDATGDRNGFTELVDEIEGFTAAQTLARVSDTERTTASARQIARLLRLRDLAGLLWSETVFRVSARLRQRSGR